MSKEEEEPQQQKEESIVRKVGLHPTVVEINRWFKAQNNRFVMNTIGGTALGHKSFVFELDPSGGVNDDTRTVLFQSLIHGNEPLGLLPLLQVAEELASQPPLENIKVIFFPFVNIDAYVDNLQFGHGCRATTQNKLECAASHENKKCPEDVFDGVDLNRNFPFNFQRSKCGTPDYSGDAPFSELESQAIRDLVQSKQPDAVISFFGRKESNEHLLVHPTLQEDDPNQSQITKWSKYLTSEDVHTFGDATQLLGSPQTGSILEWLYHDQGIELSFQFHAGTPCGDRWCSYEHAEEILEQTDAHAKLGLRLIELVRGGGNVSPFGIRNKMPFVAALTATVFVMIIIVCAVCRPKKRNPGLHKMKKEQRAKQRRGAASVRKAALEGQEEKSAVEMRALVVDGSA